VSLTLVANLPLYQRYQLYQWQSLPPVSLGPVANLPLVWLTMATKFANGVVKKNTEAKNVMTLSL
jgi:hypothetical protein